MFKKLYYFIRDAYGEGESFTDSAREWWTFITTGEYQGFEPYGERVFWTYLGRTMDDAMKCYEELYK